ncbi:Pro-neuregulin-3, membrane-bound isoform [Pitangus sulphuratus]|nr:Pro-neuregulin-3, membrane-bound isoform [Pitangus sulphuratus]
MWLANTTTYSTERSEHFKPCKDKDLAYCLNEGECFVIETLTGSHKHCRIGRCWMNDWLKLLREEEDYTFKICALKEAIKTIVYAQEVLVLAVNSDVLFIDLSTNCEEKWCINVKVKALA